MTSESHVVAEEPSVDLAIVLAMVEELEEYIVKEDLFRTVILRTPRGEVRIQMTGGDLLTRLHRLAVDKHRLSPEQQAQAAHAAQEADRIIYSLKSRFNQRLQREMKSRLDSLRWFLDDVADDSDRARTNYPYEIRNRQRVEEIITRLGGDLPEELAGQLAAVDRRLRGLVAGSEFVWDPSLRDVFPRQPYWFLYAGV